MARHRVVFLDYLRVLACFMVILVHACEFFYVGSDGISIASDYDALWTSLLNSPCRCAVPLFVMISSWLLVPLDEPVSKFMRRRLTRVVVPFLIWSVCY
ncbi:MAG: acyltransferase, partial [Muribaculaceae bacterium]|nr:acyltransferase [Muribaculaceae bacterium]